MSDYENTFKAKISQANIDQLIEYTDKNNIKATSSWGGRKYEYKDKGPESGFKESVSLNDIVKRAKQLYADGNISLEKLGKIISNIKQLDSESATVGNSWVRKISNKYNEVVNSEDRTKTMGDLESIFAVRTEIEKIKGQEVKGSTLREFGEKYRAANNGNQISVENLHKLMDALQPNAPKWKKNAQEYANALLGFRRVDFNEPKVNLPENEREEYAQQVALVNLYTREIEAYSEVQKK